MAERENFSRRFHESRSSQLRMAFRRLTAYPIPQVGLDTVIVVLSYYVALNFRYQGNLVDGAGLSARFAVFACLAVLLHLAVNRLMGGYRIISNYMGLSQAVRLCEGTIGVGAILVLVSVLWPSGQYLVPRSVVLVGASLSMLGMVAARFSPRVLRERRPLQGKERERLLLVGAGQAADMLIREISRTPSLGMRVVGLVDDDPGLLGRRIQGYPVLGDSDDIPRLVADYSVTQVLIAIPSASADEIARVYRDLKSTYVPVKVLPSVAELVSGNVSIADARDVDLRDLLGRKTVQSDLAAITAHLRGRRIMVTGAGGSIGSELCLQLARFEPDLIVLVDHDESSLYDLHEKLQNAGWKRYVIAPANILQTEKMERLFSTYRPQVVFHAAAYKHVPLMEINPDQAVINNIEGTMRLARMAGSRGVERFINISTDKAVNPLSVMGATKRAGELITALMASRYLGTRYASVRFGNVLGSQGSVIPIFRKQIEAGGPVVITHPEMSRFFMLIEEAVQLVLQAVVEMDKGGSYDSSPATMYVLEMGEPIEIAEVAHRMIEFLWKDPEKSIGVEFSGLRPGEKLTEELFWPEEKPVATSHPLVRRVSLAPGYSLTQMCGLAGDASDEDFQAKLERVIQVAHESADRNAVISALTDLIPGYTPMLKPTAKAGDDSLGELPPDTPRSATQRAAARRSRRLAREQSQEAASPD